MVAAGTDEERLTVGEPAFERVARGVILTCRGVPPSAGITNTWSLPRSLTKAICLPSGENSARGRAPGSA